MQQTHVRAGETRKEEALEEEQEEEGREQTAVASRARHTAHWPSAECVCQCKVSRAVRENEEEKSQFLQKC